MANGLGLFRIIHSTSVSSADHWSVGRYPYLPLMSLTIQPLTQSDQSWVSQLSHATHVYCPNCGAEDLALSAKRASASFAYIAWQVVLDEASLLGIAVQPSARRGKVASQLHHVSEQTLYAQGIRRLFLELRQSNHGAYAFYQQLGYEQIGVRKQYYRALDTVTTTNTLREDAILMRKCLHPALG